MAHLIHGISQTDIKTRNPLISDGILN